jgi:hypothetical protein
MSIVRYSEIMVSVEETLLGYSALSPEPPNAAASKRLLIFRLAFMRDRRILRHLTLNVSLIA